MGTIFGSNEGRLFKQGDTSFWEQHSGKDDLNLSFRKYGIRGRKHVHR